MFTATRNFGFLIYPFVLPLPIPLKWKSIALFIFIFSLASSVNFNKFDTKQVFKEPVVLLSAILFLLDPILSLIRDNFIYINDVRLSLILMPLLFLLGGNVLRKRQENILKCFVLGVFIYIFYAMAFCAHFYIQNKTSNAFELNYYLKYVLYHHLPGAIHHTYMGAFIIFSSSLLYWEKRINLIIRVLGIFLLSASIFILGSKMSIALFFFVPLFSLLSTKKTFDKKWGVISGGMLLLFSFCGLWFLLKTDLFRNFSNSAINRISLFEGSFILIKDNFMLGIGNYNIKEQLIQYSSDKVSGMDTHNVFLQEFLSNGVFGFLILTLLFSFFFLRSIGDHIYLLFVIVFLFIGTIEHILNLQLGVTFFLFFSYLFYFSANPKLDVNES